jgi:cyclase
LNKKFLRIIPRIDVRGENVVKGIQMEGVRKVGQPNELALKYYQGGADEIVFMDVVASLYGRNNILSTVEEAARDIFVPLTVGGGMRNVDDITAALRSGADKVAINTAAVVNPPFISEASKALGSQCIVLSIEAKKRDGWWEAMTHNGREPSGRNVLDWVVEAEDLGAGEILITSADKDGTKKGFDCELYESVYDRVRLPVIACGGAGSNDDVVSLAKGNYVDAICCATILHYDLSTLPGLKQSLAENGIPVRL